MWSGNGEPSSWRKLVQAATERRFVLIGENHDNADHHRIQASLISALVEQGRRPAVVFEMIPSTDQPALDAYLAGADGKAEGLGEAIGWENRGWPAWSTYMPIAEAGMQAGLPFLGGGLERSQIMAMARGGPAGMDDVERKRLGLDGEFPDPLREDLLQELKVSHCDLMPKDSLGPMVMVQRARDGSMAQAMLSAGTRGAVLIAGKGHARNDRAVPFVLRQLDEDVEASSILSVGLVGVEPGAVNFADYLDGDDRFPFDYVVFTERTEPIDYCEKLRKHFSNKGHSHGSSDE